MHFPDFDFKRIGAFELANNQVRIEAASVDFGPPCLYAWTANGVPVNFGSSSTVGATKRNNAICSHINNRLRDRKLPDRGANRLYEALRRGEEIELWARVPPTGIGLTGRRIYLTEATEIELQRFYNAPWNVRGRGAVILADKRQ